MQPATMLEALAADGPDPARAHGLALFGRVVGAWDVDYRLVRPDGSEARGQAAWLFGWTLQGRAVQDVLISPRPGSDDPDAPREHGSTIRVYDPDLDVWHVTWMSPVTGSVVHLTARADGDDALLEGTLRDGRPARWRFTEITAMSFRWLGEYSPDGGRTWILDEEMRATRRR